MHNNDVLFRFFEFVAGLKKVKRDGWNNRQLGRRVKDAESVGDHTFGTVLLAVVLPLLLTRLRLDQARLMVLCAFHDIEEVITDDVNVYVVPPGPERDRRKAEKKRRAREAMVQIRHELSVPLGPFIYSAYCEYEEGKTREAIIAKEIDKIEVLLQALWYFQRGHRVDPREFYASTAEKICTPELLQFVHAEILSRLPTEEEVRKRMKKKKGQTAKKKRKRGR